MTTIPQRQSQTDGQTTALSTALRHTLRAVKTNAILVLGSGSRRLGGGTCEYAVSSVLYFSD